jgi:aryl-alcohol dehydrogenase-like predicted oxidoreductase
LRKFLGGQYSQGSVFVRPDMRYRLLGRTGLFVSELALGTNTFGGRSEKWKPLGALDREGAGAVVRAAIDNGVNLFDTADSYGDGESELRLGQALRDHAIARANIVITTKGGSRTGPGPNAVGASRAHLVEAVEASLRRLNTDYIDLYLLHTFDPHTPVEDSVAALDQLVRQGKLRYIGCSNFAAWQVMLALGASALRGLAQFQAVECMYTIAARDIERELVPMIRNQGLGLLVWGALAGGLLTGKHGRGALRQGTRWSGGQSGTVDREAALDAVEKMRPLADARGVAVGHLAIAWLLRQPAVSSIILGARDADQLRHNLRALELDLSGDEMTALDALRPPAPEYPYPTQALMAKARQPAP